MGNVIFEYKVKPRFRLIDISMLMKMDVKFVVF